MKIWTPVEKFALLLGIVCSCVGMLGFVPGLLQPNAGGCGGADERVGMSRG